MNYNEATALLEAYPYFAYAALMALPDAPDEKRKDELRRIVAVNIGNPVDIAEILGLNSQSLADFYPDTLPPQLSTSDTIDTFLSTFGSESQSRGDVAAADDPAAAPACDSQGALTDAVTDLLYAAPENSASLLDELEALPPADDAEAAVDSTHDATADVIDSFLRNMPPPQPRRQKPMPLPQQEEKPALTESFARILIKNRNYDKALQIIQELNLKNPEKSIYFADQIRFLKKLIINQRGN